MPLPLQRLLLAMVVLAGAGVTVWASRHPFAVRDGYFHAKVRLGGVKPVRVNGLGGYVRDTCGKDNDCSCVALVHGLGDTALTWRNLLRDNKSGALPPGYRLFAFNMPGTRNSAPPSTAEGFSLQAQANTLAETLKLSCDSQARWTLVGNSLGGWISARLALDHPDLIERLVLVDSAGLHDPSGTIESAGRALAYPTLEGMKDFAARAHHRHRKAPKRVWKALVRRIERSNNEAILKTVTPKDYLDKEISQLKIPTDIIWGQSDRVIPLDMGRRFAELIDGSTFRSIQACGHVPQAECPTVVRWVVFGRDSVKGASL
jgi:pimeloyl-ACP methyl ester carboxylesterase